VSGPRPWQSTPLWQGHDVGELQPTAIEVAAAINANITVGVARSKHMMRCETARYRVRSASREADVNDIPPMRTRNDYGTTLSTRTVLGPESVR
jgi:hypothetical protein